MEVAESAQEEEFAILRHLSEQLGLKRLLAPFLELTVFFLGQQLLAACDEL